MLSPYPESLVILYLLPGFELSGLFQVPALTLTPSASSFSWGPMNRTFHPQGPVDCGQLEAHKSLASALLPADLVLERTELYSETSPGCFEVIQASSLP